MNCVSKYDTCISNLESFLKNDIIFDNDEGILSVFELHELMNTYFEPYINSFKDKTIHLKRALIYEKNNMMLKTVDPTIYPSFHDEEYCLFLDYKYTYKMERYTLHQEKDSDQFYYSRWAEPRINEFIFELFAIMKQYNKYGDFLNITPDGSTKTSCCFDYDPFTVNIVFDSKNGCSYNLSFKNVRMNYQDSSWSDGRKTLLSILKSNSFDIARKIPINVNETYVPKLFRDAYYDTKTLDNPKQIVYGCK